MKETRELADLVSVGPASLRDLKLLGILTMVQLAQCEPHDLYMRLCAITATKHDPCCEDVFSAAVAQARDPKLPAEKKKWWYWSKIRKEEGTRKRTLQNLPASTPVKRAKKAHAKGSVDTHKRNS